MNVYLDTNLWSRMLQQPTDDDLLLSSLEAGGVRLVLGNDDFYELLRTFPFDGRCSPQRALDIFSRLSRYTSRPIPIVKVNMELIAAEMWAAKRDEQVIDPFLSDEDHATVRAVIEDAANGNVSQREQEYVARRLEHSAVFRAGQIRHMRNTPATRTHLRSIPRDRLGEWLRSEALTPVGIDDLAWQIRNYFPGEATTEDSYDWAVGLLTRPHYRMSRAMTRRNLYFNWRSAHSRDSSIPSDLFDDTNHILNAIYCDVYATEESRQRDYAGLLLTDTTAVRIYDRNAFPAVSDWLLTLGA